MKITRYSLLTLWLCAAHLTAHAQLLPRLSAPAATTAPTDSLLTGNVNSAFTPADISSLFPQITPQSPNVAALGRFGDHPVSLYTGLPTIDVPLYDINAGTVRLPVKLVYHAGGNRVTDRASWVGLGWALQAPTTITRHVIGRPDEVGTLLNAGLNTTLSVTNAINNANCQQTYTDLRNYVKGPTESGALDNGYDIFSYSLPSGKSGKFILLADAATGNPVTLMPAEPLRVSVTRTSNLITAFTITDEQGIDYTFDQLEGNGTATVAWHLSRIQGLAPQDIVEFSYEATTVYSQSDDIDTYTVIDRVGTGGCPTQTASGQDAKQTLTVSSSFNPLLLTEIRFPGGKLTATKATSDRLDLPGTRALDYVQLWATTGTTTYSLIKTFDLLHSYFTDSRGGYGGNAPLRLDAVVMQDNAGQAIGRYDLTYNNTMALPGYTARSRDAWGFFNGKANGDASNTNQTTLVPLQQVTIENQNTGFVNTIPIGGADRSTDETFMQAWMLTAISYPTGGSSSFTYEANRYLDGTVKQAGGLRVRRIETRASASSPLQTKTYVYGTGQSGYGRLTENIAQNTRLGWWAYTYYVTNTPCSGYRVRVYGANYNGGIAPFEANTVVYPTVTEYLGTTAVNSGYTVYTFTDTETASDSRCGLLGTNVSKFFTESRAWARGQLKSKSVYGPAGLVSEQTTTFSVSERTVTPSIVLIADRIQFVPDGPYTNPPGFPFGSCTGLTAPGCTALCTSFLRESSDQPKYCVWRTGVLRPTQTVSRVFPSNGTGTPVSTTSQTDYDAASFQPRETRQYVEGNATDGAVVVGSRLTYPQDFTLAIAANAGEELLGIRRLRERNAYLPVEVVQFRQATVSGARQYTTGKLTTYKPITSNSQT
jgi:hypothetical protein